MANILPLQCVQGRYARIVLVCQPGMTRDIGFDVSSKNPLAFISKWTECLSIEVTFLSLNQTHKPCRTPIRSNYAICRKECTLNVVRTRYMQNYCMETNYYFVGMQIYFMPLCSPLRYASREIWLYYLFIIYLIIFITITRIQLFKAPFV